MFSTVISEQSGHLYVSLQHSQRDVVMQFTHMALKIRHLFRNNFDCLVKDVKSIFSCVSWCSCLNSAVWDFSCYDHRLFANCTAKFQVQHIIKLLTPNHFVLKEMTKGEIEWVFQSSIKLLYIWNLKLFSYLPTLTPNKGEVTKVSLLLNFQKRSLVYWM